MRRCFIVFVVVVISGCCFVAERKKGDDAIGERVLWGLGCLAQTVHEDAKEEEKKEQEARDSNPKIQVF